MPGLVPGIHASLHLSKERRGRGRGQAQAMTKKGRFLEIFGENPRTLGLLFGSGAQGVTGIVPMLARSGPGLGHLLGGIRAQVAEEFFDLAGERLGGGRQFAGAMR